MKLLMASYNIKSLIPKWTTHQKKCSQATGTSNEHDQDQDTPVCLPEPSVPTLPECFDLATAALPQPRQFLIVDTKCESFEPLSEELHFLWQTLLQYKSLLDCPPPLQTNYCQTQRARANYYNRIFFERGYHKLLFHHALYSPRIWIRFLALDIIGKMAAPSKADASTLGEAGAMEVVLDVMEMHPCDIYVQGSGLRALASLLSECQGNMGRFMRGRGLDVLIQTVGLHQNGDKGEFIVQDTSDLFQKLASYPEYRRIMETY